MKPNVWIVDDEVSLCGLLEVFFEKKGFVPIARQSVADGLSLMDGPEPAIAMVDLSLGPDSGLTLVKAMVERFPNLPVVVMTAYGTVEKAVEAVKLGAFDFISKPFEMVFLSKVVDKAMSNRILASENRELKEIIRRQGVELIGQSTAVTQLKERIHAIASSESTVLITGESGTGKELVAKLIHQKSLRATKPCVVVNCSALSENLLESELFGHVKGAFTSAHAEKEGLFAVAEGGTVFLDEIGEMPLRTQVKLLRVLQEREITPVGGTVSSRINVRILAATNVNLEDAVARGDFREDLYYRLNVLRIYTPRLAERGEDPILLANYFLNKKSHVQKRFSEMALRQIQSYAWPGNVRQLENAVERAIAFSTRDIIEALEFDVPGQTLDGRAGSHASAGAGTGNAGWGGGSAGISSAGTSAAGTNGSTGSAPNPGTGEESGVSPTLNEIEKAYIYWILTQNQWHKPTAAKILGLDISTLYRKIEKYGLKAPA